MAGCETDLLPDQVLRPVRAPKPDSGGKFVLALGEGARTYRCRGVQPQEVPGHWQHRAMGLFGRRKAAQFDTGHAGDDQLLAQLAQMGDLAAPRHWVHYLYFADEAAAQLLRQRGRLPLGGLAHKLEGHVARRGICMAQGDAYERFVLGWR